MYLELTTGRDSFRAQQASAMRNVSIQTFVRCPEDTKQPIMPLFAAYRNKMRRFKETQLVATIPATDKFGHNDAGQWFVNRHEVMPGTEILIEYRQRETTGFGEKIEHLLIIADPNAPLWRTRIDLPPHFLSAVPNAFFEGRYSIVSKDSQLEPAAIDCWKDHLGLTGDDAEYDLSLLLDPNQDEQFYNHVQLEKAEAPTQRTTVTGKGDKQRVKIRRIRRIKTR